MVRINMSFFTSFEKIPEDPILNLAVLFKADKREQKINLGIGSYKDDKGLPVVFSTVQEAEKIILDHHLDKEYLPIEGHAGFNTAMSKLIFGPMAENELKERLLSVQTVGCTSALRTGAELLLRNINIKAYFSNPTWPNHKAVFTAAGFNPDFYPYYCNEKQSFDFQGMSESIKKMPPGSVIVLHGTCHNPTGINPTQEEWKVLSILIQMKRLIPFFDIAYQGLGNDPDEDAFPVRFFAEQGHEMLVAASCSKNFGLYGERVGSLMFIGKDQEIASRIKTQIKKIIRGSYSVPPLQGARIVATILQSEKLTQQWKNELQEIRDRLTDIRKSLVEKLRKANVKTDVTFLTQQSGLFSLLNLSSSQVLRLRQEHGIYMENHGRINIAGLNSNNIDHFVEAITPYL
jgi:aspartate aminotransferase